MVELPKKPEDAFYIDRPRYRNDIQSLLKSGKTSNIVLGDTHAIYGTGKTTSLTKLFYELKDQKDSKPIWLALSTYSIPFTNKKIEAFDSLDALKQNLDDFKRLLSDLGNQIDAEAYKTLPEKMVAITDEPFENIFKINISAKAGDARVGLLTKILKSEVKGGDAKVEVNIENQDQILEFILDRKREKIAEAFLNVYEPLGKDARLIIFADDFDWIIDQKIGDWFLQVLERMNNATILISRTISESQLKWNKNEIMKLHLQPFNLEDIRSYMILRNLELTDAQLEKVYKFSKLGNPLLISLAGDLLSRLDRHDAQNIDIILDRLVGKSKLPSASKSSPVESQISQRIKLDELASSVDQIVTELREDIRRFDPVLLPGLDVLSLTRALDYDMLVFMFKQFLQEKRIAEPAGNLDIDQAAQKIAHEMLNRMEFYSVFQDFNRGDHIFYRIHYLVRERMEAILKKEEPVEYIDHLHDLLVQFFNAKQSRAMQEQPEYTRMFRLENPEWQADTIEWLHHLFYLKDREKAWLGLARAYFEGFDWWGWYMDFGFCDDLLTIWKQTQPAQDTAIIEQLGLFQTAYPLGYDKHGQGSWEEVNKALRNIMNLLRLNLPPEKMNADQRMTRGHLDRYTAEAYRFYKSPMYQRAEASYLSSLQYFEPAWNRMWITNYLADMELDWAQQLAVAGNAQEAKEKYQQAQQHALDSNRMALDEENFLDQDHELICQNYRVLGDNFFYQDLMNQAIQAYLRANIHAYIFHFLPGNRDEYSFSFYNDTSKHILDVLVKLAHQDKAEIAQQACNYLRCFWVDNAGFDYANDILTAVPDGFKLNESLTASGADLLLKYCFPVIPPAGEVGDRIDIGVAVSQQTAEIVEQDQFIPLPGFA